MELNSVYEFYFNKGSQQYEVNYFFTADKIKNTAPLPGEIWLVITVRSEENQNLYVPKSFSILRQPREIVEIIVRRESLVLLEDASCLLPFNANDTPDL